MRTGRLGGSERSQADWFQEACRHSNDQALCTKKLRAGSVYVYSRGENDRQRRTYDFARACLFRSPPPPSFPGSLSHYDSPLPVPGGTIMSQLCWCRAFPRTPRQEQYSALDWRLCECCGFLEIQVRVHPLFHLETPEHRGHLSHQPGPSCFSPNILTYV